MQGSRLQEEVMTEMDLWLFLAGVWQAWLVNHNSPQSMLGIQLQPQLHGAIPGSLGHLDHLQTRFSGLM